MIELHGWITIEETYENRETESDHQEEIVDKIAEMISDCNWQAGLLKVRYCNGQPCVIISRFANHYAKEVKEVLRLVEYIGEIAVGSYGLIYLHDDENVDGKENEFQVFALAKGKIREYRDEYLSPLIPTVEEQ